MDKTIGNLWLNPSSMSPDTFLVICQIILTIITIIITILVAMFAVRSVNKYLKQKKIDSLQNLYDEICVLDFFISGLSKLIFDSKGKFIGPVIFNNSIESINNVNVKVHQIEFFHMSDEIKKNLNPLKSLVTNILESVRDLVNFYNENYINYSNNNLDNLDFIEEYNKLCSKSQKDIAKLLLDIPDYELIFENLKKAIKKEKRKK